MLTTASLRASPRLKDAESQIPPSSYSDLYQELLLTVRKMYHECKLVHADLSEYNILYHDSHLYIIDVSQSVEHDHPHAFDFLRNDVKNTEEYFGRRGVTTLGLRRCFEFVTKERFEADGEPGLSDGQVLKLWLEKPPPDVTPSIADGEGDWDGERATGLDAQQEDSVFLKSYIPRTLNEVYDPERDLEELKKGAKTIYSNTIGIVDLKPEATSRRAGEENVLPDGEEKPKVHFSAGLEMEDETQDPGEEEEGEEEDGEEEREDENEPRENKPRGHRHEDKEAKKVIRKASFITLEWLTTRALGTQEGRQGGTTREAQSQDVQVREEEKDTDHHQQTMRWNSFAFSPPASGIPMLPRNRRCC
jgi:RIO kinase 1